MSPQATAAWRNVAHLTLPPHPRREPVLFAAWQAWRTSQGDCGTTATTRLMCLPADAQAVYFELVEFFLAGGRMDPEGRPVPVETQAC